MHAQFGYCKYISKPDTSRQNNGNVWEDDSFPSFPSNFSPGIYHNGKTAMLVPGFTLKKRNLHSHMKLPNGIICCLVVEPLWKRVNSGNMTFPIETQIMFQNQHTVWLWLKIGWVQTYIHWFINNNSPSCRCHLWGPSTIFRHTHGPYHVFSDCGQTLGDAKDFCRSAPVSWKPPVPATSVWNPTQQANKTCTLW